MKITMLTYGSRGDVQPFIALARELQKNGHDVKLAAPHRFADFVGVYNVPFVSLAGDPFAGSFDFGRLGNRRPDDPGLQGGLEPKFGRAPTRDLGLRRLADPHE